MFKKVLAIIGIMAIVSLSVFTYIKFQEKDSDLEKVRLAEVTHSVFYAPLYVAIEEGYFKDEGIDLELILTPGADKVSAAVLSNDVEVGFAGSESSIYVYNGGEENYLQTFAGLTKRDGQFIVSRNKIDDFKLEDMLDKKVLVGRVGGMPALNYENALKLAAIDSNKVNMDYSVEFANLTSAFISGNGDFVNLFEPNATKLEKEGYGYVVASVGKLSSEVPYTSFYARKSYISNNKELLKCFTKAIAKGLEFVKEKDSENIANSILNQFPDTSLNDLKKIVERYKNADSWLNDPFVSETSFNNLLEIMKDAKQITDNVPYSNLVNNLYEK